MEPNVLSVMRLRLSFNVTGVKYSVNGRDPMKFHRTTDHPKRVGGTREAITIQRSAGTPAARGRGVLVPVGLP